MKAGKMAQSAMAEKWTNQRWSRNGPISDGREMVQSATAEKWSNERRTRNDPISDGQEMDQSAMSDVQNLSL